MKEKSRAKAPGTFSELVATFANRPVRLSMSSGERREGVLCVHTDYVVLEDQYGAFAISHIASIAPLAHAPADYVQNARKSATSDAPKHR